MMRRVNVVEMFSYPVCEKLAVQGIAVLLSPSSCPVTIKIAGEFIHNQTVHTVSVVVPKWTNVAVIAVIKRKSCYSDYTNAAG